MMTENANEPQYSEQQLKNTYIPIQGRVPRYTDQMSNTGLPNFGMSPWNLVTSVLATLGISAALAPSVLWGGVLIVSSVTGDDATGTRNDVAKPYRTITQAVNAASTGDIIVVQPGTYTESKLVKANVSLYCQPGATIVVSAFDANTLTISGRHGIYGAGVFQFSTASIATVQPNIAVNSEFTFEAEYVSLSKVSITWYNLRKLILNFKRILTSEASLYEMTDPVADSLYTVRYGIVDTADLPSKMVYINKLVTGTFVDIHIANAKIRRMDKITGFICTASNPKTSKIKVQVDAFNYSAPQNFQESTAPIATDTVCYAVKDYSFGKISTTGYLYRWITTGTTDTERGTMKFQGNLRTYTAGQKLSTFIDFMKVDQAVQFDLDIVDDTTETLGGVAALLNLSSASSRQRVTGRIETTRDNSITDGVLVYGNDTTGAAAPGAATLERFTIVSSGAACVRFDGGTQDLPCKSVYANNATSADNGGVNVVIDSSITVDPYVI